MGTVQGVGTTRGGITTLLSSSIRGKVIMRDSNMKKVWNMISMVSILTLLSTSIKGKVFTRGSNMKKGWNMTSMIFSETLLSTNSIRVFMREGWNILILLNSSIRVLMRLNNMKEDWNILILLSISIRVLVRVNIMKSLKEMT